MKIYQQDPSGALIGPVELPPVPGGGLLIPFGFLRLEQALPDPTPGSTWSIANGEAQLVEDHRGQVYDTQTGAPIDWRELGPLPEGVTLQPRPSELHRWQDGQWVIDLQALHTLKVVAINQACEAAITAGFPSSALGSPYTYGSQLEDQLNLTGAVLRGLEMDYPCRDDQGVKAYRLHTLEQLSQVSADFTLFKLQLLQRADELKQQLDQALLAGDADALESIAWGGV